MASPTAKQGKDILEARKLIEVEIVKDVIKYATPSDFDLLKKIVKSEEDNIAHEHMVEGIQLGGDFHLMLAKISKNETLEHILKSLIPQTSLVIVLYENPDAPKCSHLEHFDLIDVMEKGLIEEATNLMHQHIESIEARLKLNGKEFTSDLVDIFKQR
ncbi:GntR family transcriptional regulator [Colwellia hornerae]|uniref:GntR family transcriptional regulator n=1 Tax=Colwellia hornerae TaxID=89402 RepID=A0A5C6Q921_9GAMM|nr:GntR family transcriptional regulator [Colwellia hornerae]TWX56127.1 GntR family transcriptional regulator [Colwellia hornerae]TWX65150.1 GntR family transcriptional regulator [Colwellia hornerae]